MPTIPVPDYTEYDGLKNRVFKQKAARAIVLKETIAEAEGELREIREWLEPEIVSAGVKLNGRILFNGAQIAVCDQSAGERLDERLLLENGVKRSTIDKCKVPNKRRHYVLIQLPGEEKE